MHFDDNKESGREKDNIVSCFSIFRIDFQSELSIIFIVGKINSSLLIIEKNTDLLTFRMTNGKPLSWLAGFMQKLAVEAMILVITTLVGTKGKIGMT
ncbi:hypothetical protein ACJX0J_036933, partial [Zea mays]